MEKMRSFIAWMAVAVALLLPLQAVSQHSETRVYTEQHPLVYVDAWDLWPYSFLNEQGEPEGFNIDLVKMLCKQLNIPYVIRLKPTGDALNDLKARHADLMLGMDAPYHDEYASYGEQTIQLFTHSVVTPKNRPVAVKTEDDLSSNRVIVHQNSFSHHLMIDSGWGANAHAYDDMKEAIQMVSMRQEGQMAWNTLSLKWLMHKFHTDNLQITPVDMPHGFYKFMSNDSLLLHRIDSVYAYLRSHDKLQPVMNRWFYPDRVESGIPSWIWYAVAAMAFVAVVLAFYYVNYRIREKAMAR